MQKILAACALWAASAVASAGVIYNWQTTATSDTISSAVGRIEISDAAFLAGGGSYSAPPGCSPYGGPCAGDPSSPVVSFYFRVNSPSSTGADIDVNLVQGTGALYPMEGWFNANFAIDGDSLMLDVFANTGETDMRMESNVITRFGSDAPYFGCYAGCSGASGRWVQMMRMQPQLVVQVPEPGTVLLFGIGVIATVLSTRRRRG